MASELGTSVAGWGASDTGQGASVCCLGASASGWGSAASLSAAQVVQESTEEEVAVKQEEEVEERSSQVSQGGRAGGREGGTSCPRCSSSRLSLDLMLDLEVLWDPPEDRRHDHRSEPALDLAWDSSPLLLWLRASLWASREV